MTKHELPRWLKYAGALLPILATLFAVGSWVNEKWMSDTFITRVEAGEQHKTIVLAETKKDVEVRLQLVALEINWLASQQSLHPALQERLTFLRTQQRVLMEQHAQLN